MISATSSTRFSSPQEAKQVLPGIICAHAGLLDVQETMPAVSTPSDLTKLHRRVPVTMKSGVVKQCRGGADVQSVLQYFDFTLREFFASSYLGTLPIEHRRVDMSNMRQSCENLRLETKAVNQVVFFIIAKIKIQWTS